MKYKYACCKCACVELSVSVVINAKPDQEGDIAEARSSSPILYWEDKSTMSCDVCGYSALVEEFKIGGRG